jgi:hypothetical protein
MSTKTYDPKKIHFSFAGSILTGYAPDTFLEVERDEDAYTKQVGATGEVVRSRNNNRGGKITLTLMADSASNDILSAIAAADEVGNAGVAPVLGEDANGTTLFSGANAWIQKMPKVERGKEAGTVQWAFDVAELKIFAGGLS